MALVDLEHGMIWGPMYGTAEQMGDLIWRYGILQLCYPKLGLHRSDLVADLELGENGGT